MNGLRKGGVYITVEYYSAFTKEGNFITCNLGEPCRRDAK